MYIYIYSNSVYIVYILYIYSIVHTYKNSKIYDLKFHVSYNIALYIYYIYSLNTLSNIIYYICMHYILLIYISLIYNIYH